MCCKKPHTCVLLDIKRDEWSHCDQLLSFSTSSYWLSHTSKKSFCYLQDVFLMLCESYCFRRWSSPTLFVNQVLWVVFLTMVLLKECGDYLLFSILWIICTLEYILAASCWIPCIIEGKINMQYFCEHIILLSKGWSF